MVSQIVAAVIFVSMFVLIVSEKFERHVITLVCAWLTLVLVFGVCMRSADAAMEALSLQSIFRPEFWYQAGGGAAPSASTGRRSSLSPA